MIQGPGGGSMGSDCCRYDVSNGSDENALNLDKWRRWYTSGICQKSLNCLKKKTTIEVVSKRRRSQLEETF